MEYKKTVFNFYYQWWKNIDKFIFFLIVLLFCTGLFFSLVSTSLVASDKLNTNDYSFFFKHFIFILLGVFIIFFLSSIDKEIELYSDDDWEFVENSNIQLQNIEAI